MSDIEEGSLRYLLGRTQPVQWQGFLSVLADELNAQMPAVELRAFFRALGHRLALKMPLAAGDTLASLEQRLNERLDASGWGWASIRDNGDSLDIQHSCAPLRQAFGNASAGWTGGLLEGLYSDWMKQAGAGDALELRQIGEAPGSCETYRFRLAHPSVLD